MKKTIICGLDLSPNSSGATKLILDEKFNVIKSDYLGFTTTKKYSHDENIHYYNNSSKNPTYHHYFSKFVWMKEKIAEFTKDCDYVAIEDYAFAGIGKVFNIAEFAGMIKLHLFENNKKVRLYDPGSIKIFATDRGNCDKISMNDAYEELYCDYKMNLSHLPIVDISKGRSPTSDIIDSFFIVELLYLELQLRKALVNLTDYSEQIIKVMNRVTKSRPENILSTEFIQQEKKDGIN